MSVKWYPAEAVVARPVLAPPGLNLLWFIGAHVLIALAMHFMSFASAVHAGLTLSLAFWWAFTDVRLDRIALSVAYITGAEVLWRMTNDHLPWELGKYAVTVICLVATFRTNRWSLSWGLAAFALLLPSAALTAANYDFDEARDQLSFNLSGPLAMCACAALFANIAMSPALFHRLCLSLMAPVCGIATITLFMIVTNNNLEFSHQSNFALSGGFGPNQVSAALGLGFLVAFLYLFEAGTPWYLRATAFALMLWFGMQSALTFSRGGLFSAVGGLVAAVLWRATEPRALLKPLAIGIVVITLGYTVVWPRLDRFTGGNITQRFQETDTSLRADLGEADLQLWREHRLLGVGPGRSKLGHLDDLTSHTEFTRLLAEHGTFGLAVMVLMIGVVARNLWRAPAGRERGYVAAFAAWAVLFMLNSAMRLVAPSFMFGLGCARFTPVATPVKAPAPAAVPSSRWTLVASR